MTLVQRAYRCRTRTCQRVWLIFGGAARFTCPFCGKRGERVR